MPDGTRGRRSAALVAGVAGGGALVAVLVVPGDPGHQLLRVLGRELLGADFDAEGLGLQDFGCGTLT